MEIKRDSYLNKIIDKMNNGKVKVITGIRRSGKSYFLFNIFNKYLLSKGVNENNIIKISLDSIKDIALRNPLNLIKHIEQLLPSNSLAMLCFNWWNSILWNYQKSLYWK